MHSICFVAFLTTRDMCLCKHHHIPGPLVPHVMAAEENRSLFLFSLTSSRVSRRESCHAGKGVLSGTLMTKQEVFPNTFQACFQHDQVCRIPQPVCSLVLTPGFLPALQVR